MNLLSLYGLTLVAFRVTFSYLAKIGYVSYFLQEETFNDVGIIFPFVVGTIGKSLC